MGYGQGFAVGQLYARMNLDNTDFDKKLTQSKKQLTKFDNSISNIGRKTVDFGKKASLAISAPLSALQTVASLTASRFETAITDAAAVAGATGETFTRMADAAKHYGATTLYTATEAAQGMYYLASAGYDAEQQIQSLGAILQFGAATHMDLAEASILTVSTLNQYGLAANNASRVTNTFAAAITKSQATAEKLGVSMRYVGALAGTYGNSVEETTAALSLLYNAGLEASQAGTSIRGMFTSLLSPSAAAREELARVGVSLDALDPKMNDISQIIRTLETSGAQLNKIFSARALTGVQILVNSGADALENLQLEITGTNKAAEIFGRQLDTFHGRMGLVKSAAEALAGSFGTHVNDVLESLAQGAILPLIQVLDSLDDSTKEWLVYMGMTATVIPPIVGLTGKLILLLEMKKIATLNDTIATQTNTVAQVANQAATKTLYVAKSLGKNGLATSATAYQVETAAIATNTAVQKTNAAAHFSGIAAIGKLALALLGPAALVAAFAALTFSIAKAIRQQKEWNHLIEDGAKLAPNLGLNSTSKQREEYLWDPSLQEAEIKLLKEQEKAVESLKKKMGEVNPVDIVGGLLYKSDELTQLENVIKKIEDAHDRLLVNAAARARYAREERDYWKENQDIINKASREEEMRMRGLTRAETVTASQFEYPYVTAQRAITTAIAESKYEATNLEFQIQDSMRNYGLSAEQATQAIQTKLTNSLEKLYNSFEDPRSKTAFLNNLREMAEESNAITRKMVTDIADQLEGIKQIELKAPSATEQRKDLLSTYARAVEYGIVTQSKLLELVNENAREMQDSIINSTLKDHPSASRDQQNVIVRTRMQDEFDSLGLNTKQTSGDLVGAYLAKQERTEQTRIATRKAQEEQMQKAYKEHEEAVKRATTQLNNFELSLWKFTGMAPDTRRTPTPNTSVQDLVRQHIQGTGSSKGKDYLDPNYRSPYVSIKSLDDAPSSGNTEINIQNFNVGDSEQAAKILRDLGHDVNVLNPSPL